MAKKGHVRPAEAEISTAPVVETGPLQRRTVFISDADLEAMEAAFSNGQSVSVTVHHPPASSLTDAQREKRKAYRQRPEVREKQRAYRAARAKRLREAKRATAPTVSTMDTKLD